MLENFLNMKFRKSARILTNWLREARPKDLVSIGCARERPPGGSKDAPTRQLGPESAGADQILRSFVTQDDRAKRRLELSDPFDAVG